MTDGMNKPEIETLSYHSSLCKCPDCKQGHKPAQEVKEKTTLGQPQQCHNTMTGRECIDCKIYAAGECHLSKPEQPKSVRRGFMGLGCNKPNQLIKHLPGREHIKGCECGQCPEQPKDNPGPLEKLIMDRIEHDLENIAANLEMLNPETKEQNRAKCVLTLEIARITDEGGMFDDLKEAFE